MASPHGKLGPNVSTNRNTATVQAPSATVAGAELTTEIYTYLAKPPVAGQLPILYNADRQQTQLILELEGAGPVAISTKQQILPVLSGKGALLKTGQRTPFYLAKGQRLYVAASSINRISVTIQPIPWLEQITGLLGRLVSTITSFFGWVTKGRQ